MALRVLLADESTTIKKVMQLALQDFAVEVKAVHVGLDVVEVARQFQPDIIFADVLLQKKNGYEVCGELKRDPNLKSIPVVLMWSSFMDLDEPLARECGADHRLEKPFDIENLRQVLLDLVPRTHTQRLAHFLKFPSSIAEPMAKEEAQKRPNPTPPTAAPPASATPVRTAPPAPKSPFPLARPSGSAETSSRVTPAPPEPAAETRPDWNMDNFDGIESFELAGANDAPTSSVDDDDDDENFSEFRIQTPAARGYTGPSAHGTPNTPPPVSNEEGDEAWSHQDLSRFKLDLPPVTASNAELGIDFEISDESEDYPRTPRAFTPPPAENNTRSSLSKDGPGFGISDFSTNTGAQSQASFGSTGRSQTDNDLLLGHNEIETTDNEVDGNFILDDQTGDRDFEFTSPRREEATFITHSQAQPTDSNDFPADEVSQIPQLSSDRLEQIIRAQSREIIESVVRKIVPDLATDIIREELQRLLEDTAIRERR